MPYLAGLLHDVGKIIIEFYFPKEFEQIIVGAVEKGCSHAEMEKSILGVDHTQIGAAMCECMQVHAQILQAVRFHHDPANAEHASDPHGDEGFLATCVSAADRVANTVQKTPKETPQAISLLELCPELSRLQKKYNARLSDLNVQSELKTTEQDLVGML
jgi:HD-like signal output (HDOD) protein